MDKLSSFFNLSLNPMQLRVIQCIDVAEQSLSALAKLSKRHSSSLLKAVNITIIELSIDRMIL